MTTMIDKAIGEYGAENIIGVYALFSGGHDSLVATHLASQHPAFSGVIHIDTTTGLAETRQFVEETCRDHGWQLYVKRPFLPYESYLVKFGFPGPPLHRIMYDRLKDRPLRQILRELKDGHANKAKILLVSGVRQGESDRRAEINTNYHEEGVRVWIPLIADFTAADVREYIKAHGLRRSPVKDMLHMSGECFCGAFARPSEYQEIELFYPYQAERIRRWQALVEQVAESRRWEIELGLTPPNDEIPAAQCRWGWKDGLPHEQIAMPMCFDCRHAATGEQ